LWMFILLSEKVKARLDIGLYYCEGKMESGTAF